jgi:hypothetical protein
LNRIERMGCYPTVYQSDLWEDEKSRQTDRQK